MTEAKPALAAPFPAWPATTGPVVTTDTLLTLAESFCLTRVSFSLIRLDLRANSELCVGTIRACASEEKVLEETWPTGAWPLWAWPLW